MIWLSQGEGAADLHAGHRAQVLGLLLLGAAHVDRAHRQAGLNDVRGGRRCIGAREFHLDQAVCADGNAGLAVDRNAVGDKAAACSFLNTGDVVLGLFPRLIDGGAGEFHEFAGFLPPLKVLTINIGEHLVIVRLRVQ